jgi:Tol biopolymer transport system component/DNA-binding winged helix-turn-helix (wHTH) protein
MMPTKCLVFRFSDLEVDESELRVTRGEQALEIEPKAFRVLLYLIKHAGHLVSKSELIEAVWGETAVTDNSLTRAIALLRRVLEDDPRQPQFIETVSTAGYRFICPVETTDSAKSSTQVADDVPISGATQELQKVLTPASNATNSRSWLRHRRRRWLAAAAALVATGIAVSWWEWWSRPAAPYVTSIEAITHDRQPKICPLTDGARVYFTAWPKLAQVSTAGGESSVIATPFEWNWANDIAPDKSSLLVEEAQWYKPSPLWIVPLPGGAPHRLGSLSADYATWAPDGSQILFVKGAEIWAANPDGSQARKLLAAAGIAYNPRISSDGERIRFSVSEKPFTGGLAFGDRHAGTLWEANRDGSGAHQLLPGWQEHPGQVAGSWNLDGGQYVFSARSRKGQYDLWLTTERSGWFPHRRAAPVQLTRGPLAFSYPVFSPDGRTIFAVGEDRHCELMRLDPATHQAATYLSGISATEEAFSADGQWVTYITWPDFVLWRSRTDGSGRLQLTPRSGSAGFPRWSPDGKRIAFQWSDAGKPTKLAVISREGGAPEEMIPESEDNHEQTDPTWSPDGEQIIFARDSTESSTVRMELLRVDLRSRKVVPVPGSEGLYSPRWSPDGRYLAAFSRDTHSIHLFDFEKEVWTMWFTSEQGHVGWNSWSKDSRALYFLTDKAGNQIYWRIDVGKQTPKKIVDLPDEQLAPILAPDGGIVYTHDLTTYEIYAIHLNEK